MGLSKEIVLTVKDYEIKLNRDIKFYENDTIDLCFSILEYGIEVKDGVAVNKLMPINALKAYMLIETPQGVDYAESTKVENNRVVFNLGNKYSQFIGIGKMQIVIKDNDGCRVTLPEFPFEIRQSINSNWDKDITVFSTENNEIIIDEFGRKIELKKISEMEEANILPIDSYSMILDNNENKKIKTNLITQKIENDLQLVNEQLDNKASKDDFNIYNNYYNSRRKVIIPNEFNFSKQIDIRKIAPLTYEVLKKPIDYFPLLTNKKIYYVSCTNGANTNDGLTTETPLKTIVKAMTMPDVGEIRIMGGMYSKDEASLNAQQNLTIKIVGLKEYGETYFTGSSSVTWTSYNSIWKCTRSNTKGCFDMDYTDADNNYIPLSQKNSIEEVENTPHSYYFNSATNEVYLRTFNDRQPTNDKIHLVLQQSGTAKGNGIYYYENINFIFGNGVDVSINKNTDVLIALFENCKFNYNLNGANNVSLNGLNVNGAKFVYLNNCEASRNESDGFNYYDKLGVTGEVIEVNCCGYENGYLLKDEIGNDNGSTSHENYKVVRVNCDYRYNFGPNIADVNNTRSCNIGVVASSTRTTTGVQADFQLEGDSYLINCYSDGKSKYSIAQTQENNVYVRDSVILGDVQKDLIDF